VGVSTNESKVFSSPKSSLRGDFSNWLPPAHSGDLSKGIVTFCQSQLVKKYPFKRKLQDKNIDQKMGYKKPEHQKNGRRSKRQLHFLN